MTVRVMAMKSGVTAEDHRFAHQATIAPAGANNARAGVFPNGSNPADLQGVSALQAKVTPFQAFIDGTANTLQAGYLFTSDTDVTLTFSVGNGANPRIDLVVARVYDNPYDSSGFQEGEVAIVEGTPAGSPSPPPVPASSIPLWQVTVAANASGANPINFTTARTDRRFYTAAVGAIVPIASATERDAIVEPFNGMVIYRIDQKWIETYDGAAWKVQGATTTTAPNQIIFTASGSLTSAQVVGAKALRVQCIGGGSAGAGAPSTGSGQASAGGGGGAGAYAMSLLNMTALTFPITVTIGAGGTPASGAAGGGGGNTSFGTHVIAAGSTPGGSTLSAGSSDAWATGGTGGTKASPSVGQLTVDGADGYFGQRVGTAARGGRGGSSFFGAGQRQSNTGSNAGFDAAANSGAGGSGANNGVSASAKLGGAGGSGVCIVEVLY